LGGATNFSIRFAPSDAGQKTAALRILSNDSDESPYDVALTGTSRSALESWRQSNFGTIANTGPAADNADPEMDGLENLVEFAFALNPNLPDADALPAWQVEDNEFTLNFERPPGVSGVTYIAEYSTSLVPGSWLPAANAVSPPAYAFYAPATTQRLYVRVRVTAP
jgi:hypothetical protein